MEIRSVPYQEGTAGKSARYREGIARTSVETKFSGVHKDSSAARGPGARVLASPFSNSAKNISCKAGPPQASSRDSCAQKFEVIRKIKN